MRLVHNSWRSPPMIRADTTSCPGLFRRSKSPESERQLESSEWDIKKPLNHSIEGSKTKTKQKKKNIQKATAGKCWIKAKLLNRFVLAQKWRFFVQETLQCVVNINVSTISRLSKPKTTTTTIIKEIDLIQAISLV